MRRLALLLLTALVVVGCGSSKNTVPVKTYSGVLVANVAENPKATVTWYLATESGKSYKLRFAAPYHVAKPGTYVAVSGRLERNTIRKAVILPTSVRTTSPRTVATGTKKIAWIVYTWKGTAAPWTKEQVESSALTGELSVKSFYEKVSFTKLKIEGHVYGIYTVNAAKACLNGPQLEARAKAEADGYNKANFTNVQYIYPECGGFTEGQKAGCLSPCESWVNTNNVSKTNYVGANMAAMGHEVGHNFGIEHAHDIKCAFENAGLPYTNAETHCTFTQYGLRNNIMGRAGVGLNLEAPQKAILGWWEESQVKEVTTTGNYTVLPNETNAAGIHLLKIKRPGQAGNHEDYCVEFHQPTKPYLDLEEIVASSLYEPYYGGAFVGLCDAGAEPTALYMDPTAAKPETEETQWIYSAPSLKPGQTYTNSTDKISLKTESVSPAGAVVKVTFGAKPIPETPEKPTTTGVSVSQIALTWPKVANAEFYDVYRDGVKVGSSAAYKLTFVDTGLERYTYYTYCIKARNTEGTSACSATKLGLTLERGNVQHGGIIGWAIINPEDPVPVPNVRVSVKVAIPGGKQVAEDHTNLQGFFFINDLPEGSYEVTFYPGRGGYYIQTFNVQVEAQFAKTRNISLAPIPEEEEHVPEILWKGDGSEPVPFWEQWTAVFYGPTQSSGNCGTAATSSNTNNANIKVETTGVAAGAYQKRAIKLASKTGEICYNAPRSELGSDKGNHGIYSVGQKAWIAFEFYLPEPGYEWQSGLTQWQDVSANCNPPIGYGTKTNELWLKIWDKDCSSTNENKKVGTIARNKWYKLVTYINFSRSNSEGEVKAYLAKQGEAIPAEPQVTETHRTIHGENEECTCKPQEKDTSRIGLYPSVGGEMYIAGYTVATNQADAEKNAFGP